MKTYSYSKQHKSKNVTKHMKEKRKIECQKKEERYRGHRKVALRGKFICQKSN